MKTAPVKVKNILSTASNLDDRLITDYKKLKSVVDSLKDMGYRIVLTQGVYDMIHEGHAKYLERALSYGDILVVGVDSDELTRKRKGPSRPIVPQAERLQMLSHLRSVSILTVREAHHDIGLLIKTIRPHVLVTSKSTKDFSIDEAKDYGQYAEKVVVLPPQAATSTTARVRLLTISGADQLAADIMRGIPELVKHALESLKNQ